MNQPGYEPSNGTDLAFEGRNGLVLGATGGLGTAIVRKLATVGAGIFAHGAKNEKALGDLRAEPGVVGALADLRDPDDMEGLHSAVSEWCDEALDFMIYCAGVNPSAHAVRDISVEDWDSTLAVNLSGAFHSIRSFLPMLRNSAHPKIVIVSSIFGIESPANRGAYGASKHGLAGLVQSVAREEGDWLHINALCPGPVWGDNVRRIFVNHAQERGITLEEYVKERVSKIPAGRFLEPEEFARTVLAFCSPFTDYINGQLVQVTGGACE